jgi:hypothetical protein
MKIALIFFTDQRNTRPLHTANDDMLRMWQYFYKHSGSTIEPVIITDRNTKISKLWQYGHVAVEDSEPPERLDILHKVGWLKMQAFDLLGETLVMDLDALVVRNIDNLKQIRCKIAMSPYPAGKTTPKWPYKRLNAGTMILNDSSISKRFQEVWHEKKSEFLQTTYFDELIFTSLHTELEGEVLSTQYQAEWEAGNDEGLYQAYDNQDNKVLHFCSIARKEQLQRFYASQIRI